MRRAATWPVPWLLVPLALAVVLAGCGRGDTDGGEAEITADDDVPPAPERDRPDATAPVDITTDTLVENLAVPWGIAFTAEGAYVTERDSGRLLRLVPGTGAREVRSFDVDNAGEGGLLGLAASPDFRDDRFLYAYYTTPQDNRVVRFTPDGRVQPLLTGIPSAAIHNGGRIAFGPDGMLYVTTGDAGNPARAPDPSSLGGKILRLTPAGDVPADNPQPDSLVYAAGLRNPQGLAWDEQGRLYVNEFGPDVDDAILRVKAGSDQGWGRDVADAGAGARDFPDPVAVAQPPEASWSGGTVLHDSAIPQWDGDLLAAALRGARLWRVDLATGERQARFVGRFGRLRAAVQAPDGSVWLLTSNRNGRGDPVPADDRIIRVGPPSD